MLLLLLFQRKRRIRVLWGEGVLIWVGQSTFLILLFLSEKVEEEAEGAHTQYLNIGYAQSPSPFCARGLFHFFFYFFNEKEELGRERFYQ